MKNWLKSVPISSVTIGDRFRKDLGNLGPLQQSIRERGLLQPIGLTPDHELIFGQRRLAACQKLGHKHIQSLIINIDSLLLGEHDENSDEIRKPFTNSEKLAIAKAIKEELGERRGRPEKSGQLATINDGEKTREIAAKAAGFKNSQEMRRAEVVVESCCQDVQDAVDDHTVSLSDAASIAEEPHDVQEAALKKVVFGDTSTLSAAIKAVHKEREEFGVEDEPLLDLLGNPIPKNLMPLVEDNLLFKECQEDALRLRRKLDMLDKRPTSAHRDIGKLQSHCLAIERAMTVERFGFGCPACQGQGIKSCKVCQGKAWFIAGDKDKVTPLKIKRTA